MDQTRRARLFRDALRHRWRIIAGVLVLGTAAGVLLSLQRPVTQTSTVSLLINPLIGNPFTTEGQGDDLVSLQSESQLVVSDPVTIAVADELGLQQSNRLLGSGVRVTVPPNTQILELSVSGANPEAVQDVAAALSERYLLSREALARASIDSRAEALEDTIRETQGRLTTAQELSETGPESQRRLQARLADGYQSDLFNLRADLIEVQSTAVDPGRVITPATEAQASSSIIRVLLLAFGVLGGLVLGVLLAVTRERKANLVRSSADLHQLSVAILADFSTVTAPTARLDTVRRLRMEVLGRVTPPLTIVVAPCSAHGNHHVPIAMSQSIAELGNDCVLVDGDGSALPPRAALPSRVPGLSDVMLEDQSPLDLLQSLSSNLQFLPPGAELEVARDRFVTSRMPQKMHQLKPRATFLIIEAPDLSDIAGEALAGVADVLILVVTLNRTTLSEVQRVETSLSARGVSVLGAVLVTPDTDLASTVSLPTNVGHADATVATDSATHARRGLAPSSDRADRAQHREPADARGILRRSRR
ncbi:MAG: hypothetical protein M3419_01170 [Actinomycetota bacterium]|nr:hypothetical protein [Actinomycetota bacterium]